MARKIKAVSSTDTLEVHKFYMEIINCIPDIVYWIDVNGALKGCNNSFVKWLGFERMEDFSGTPYEQMAKFGKCDEKRIEAFKLDDMAVMFSGEAKYNVVEKPLYNKENEPSYYLANRVPLFNEDKQVKNVVVVLSDITAQKHAEELLVQLAEEKKVSKELKDRPRILIVEDNACTQKIEKEMLEELHCQVDVADSSDQAVLFFEPGKYQIVFMDIGLKDTSGDMVAKKMRDKEVNAERHVPIIALTTHQMGAVPFDCKDYFVDCVVTRPLTCEQVQQIIEQYLL